MSDPSDRQPPAGRCGACDAVVEAGARFCSVCGHDLLKAEPHETASPASFEFLGRPRSHQAAATRGGARRRGTPEWLAIAIGFIAVFAVWLLISRPGGETEAIDVSPTSVGRDDSADTIRAADDQQTAPTDGPTTTTTTTTTSRSTAAGPAAGTDPLASAAAAASVPLTDLTTDGWRLLVGDGEMIVDVDLSSGDQVRHSGVGAPLAVIDGRLLVYRDSRLAWSSPDDLGQPAEEIVVVAPLQRMLTRGRSADRPVVVGDGPEAAIWWPNNNANPQTWAKIHLADGRVLDSIALTETVYGGPEVVATVGSGTFERIDGRWVSVGDLFASSASQQAIVGQRCAQPDVCDWVLQRRGEPADPPERLAIPLGGPFDLRLVADADRILLLQGGGVTDHGTGRFVPVPGADGESVTAVNRSHLLALADGANIGLRSSVVTLIDLDSQSVSSVSRIAIDDIVPRWLVLIPPPTP